MAKQFRHKKFSNSNENKERKCPFFQTGHCSQLRKGLCPFSHLNIVCYKLECTTKCGLRHPNPCKLFAANKCLYSQCSYTHSTPRRQQDTANVKPIETHPLLLASDTRQQPSPEHVVINAFFLLLLTSLKQTQCLQKEFEKLETTTSSRIHALEQLSIKKKPKNLKHTPSTTNNVPSTLTADPRPLAPLSPPPYPPPAEQVLAANITEISPAQLIYPPITSASADAGQTRMEQNTPHNPCCWRCFQEEQRPEFNIVPDQFRNHPSECPVARPAEKPTVIGPSILIGGREYLLSDLPSTICVCGQSCQLTQESCTAVTTAKSDLLIKQKQLAEQTNKAGLSEMNAREAASKEPIDDSLPENDPSDEEIKQEIKNPETEQDKIHIPAPVSAVPGQSGPVQWSSR